MNPVELDTELAGLAAVLRRHGLPVPGGAVQAAVEALAALREPTRTNVHRSGRMAFCANPEDLSIYDRAFALWFSDRSWMVETDVLARRPDAHIGLDRTEGTDDDSASPSTLISASRVETLRRRDLRELSAEERAQAERMIAQLRARPPMRISRRSRRSPRGRLDLRATTAQAMGTAGELMYFRYRQKRRRHRRTVLLIDVSGSMADYADACLLFAHAVCRSLPDAEVFAVGTRLTRLTRALRSTDPREALARASAQVEDWSGGTRLGDQFKTFLDVWGQRGLARGVVAVVFSDGWERGGADQLARQTGRLARLAHRLVWCDPHSARPGYQPLTAGMQAVLPYVDALTSGHSVAALEELARDIAQAVRRDPRLSTPGRALASYGALTHSSVPSVNH